MNPALPPELHRTPYPFANPSTTLTVPIGAVMRITNGTLSTDGEIVDQVGQADSTFKPVFLVNIGQEVPPVAGGLTRQGIASALLSRPGYAQYDSAGWTPTIGDFCSPKPGSWQLQKGGGNFVVVGTTLSSPDRVQVMQNLGGDGLVLAVLTIGPLLACDLSGGSGIISGAALPSQVADLYTPVLSSSLSFTLFSAGQTIYNPTPFEYATGSILILRKFNGFYLVERAYDSKPHAACSTSGIVGSISGGFLQWGITGSGNIATAAGSNITIRCPMMSVSANYRVTFSGVFEFLPLGSPRADLDFVVSLRKNGADQFGNRFDQRRETNLASGHSHTVQTLSTGVVRLPVHFVGQAAFAKDDVLDVQITGSLASILTQVTCVMTIDPLFCS